jgi:hypothetical protein
MVRNARRRVISSNNADRQRGASCDKAQRPDQEVAAG